MSCPFSCTETTGGCGRADNGTGPSYSGHAIILFYTTVKFGTTVTKLRCRNDLYEFTLVTTSPSVSNRQTDLLRGLHVTFLNYRIHYYGAQVGLLMPTSLASAVAAVASLHVDAGVEPPPRSQELRRILRGAEASFALAGGTSSAHSRRPISHSLLCMLADYTEASPLLLLTVRTAFSFMFFGLLRAGELLARRVSLWPILPRLSDVQDHGDFLVLTLRSSKAAVWVPAEVVIGKAPSTMDPVALFRSMLRARAASGEVLSPSSFLFALRFAQERPLSYGATRCIFKRAIGRLGLEPGAYGLHSFRIGAATILELAGTPSHLTQLAGRWSSDAFRRYCRSSLLLRARFAATLASLLLD